MARSRDADAKAGWPRPARRPRRPTPIPISRGVANLLGAAVLGVLAWALWAAPVVLVVALGGFAMAVALSSPVRLLARVLPRPLAILLSFLVLLALVLLAAYVLLPLMARQVGALVLALPTLIDSLERLLAGALGALDEAGLLSRSPEEIAAGVGNDLTADLGALARRALGSTVGLVAGTFGFLLTLFGALVVAAMLLANARGIKAAVLRAVPRRHRWDARELWNGLDGALTRYLGGLALILAIQGAASAVALWLIGVPYPLALGAWVAITAVIPFLGAWIGSVPAVLVALSVSTRAVVLTALAFLAIQQLEGNVLTPRIQGRTTGVPSVVVFLAVLGGGALFGLMGVLLAVPALAVLRVLVDFLRPRLRVVTSAR